MKKLLLVLCLILFLPTLAQAQIYKNAALNFQVNLPDTWLEVPPEDDTQEVFPLLIRTEEESRAVGIIDIYIENIQAAFGDNSFPSLTEASEAQIETMIDTLIADLKENYPDVTILSNEKTTINSLPAIVIVHSYSYTSNNKVIMVNAYWTVFIENNHLYSLKLQTDDTSNVHMNDFFKMCESVELL